MAKSYAPYREMYARRAAELDYMNKEIQAYGIQHRFDKYFKMRYLRLREVLAQKLIKFANNTDTRKIGVFNKHTKD